MWESVFANTDAGTLKDLIKMAGGADAVEKYDKARAGGGGDIPEVSAKALDEWAEVFRNEFRIENGDPDNPADHRVSPDPEGKADLV